MSHGPVSTIMPGAVEDLEPDRQDLLDINRRALAVASLMLRPPLPWPHPGSRRRSRVGPKS